MKTLIRFLLATFLILIVDQAMAATTWYVRSDGGTSTQCVGTTDAAYPGSGTGQACAMKNLYQLLQWTSDDGSSTRGTLLVAGGDTIYLSKASDTFSIGATIGALPSNCTSSVSYGCYLKPPPSGPDAAHPTRILGYGYASSCPTATKVQLYGTQGVKRIFDFSGVSHLDVECLEITDHSACGFRVGGSQCSESYGSDIGTYGRVGIYAHGGTDFVFKYLDIHGMAYYGKNLGGIAGFTETYSNEDGNHFANWDGDVGESGSESSFTGNIVLDNYKNRFSGCREVYPRSATFNAADYTDCTDQNSTGYGDGAGFYNTAGNWYITNSEFSHATSDGLDLLYHTSGDVYIDKTLFEGNTGNQLKMTAKNAEVDNSIFIANCGYLKNASKVFNTSTWSSCRANGTPISATPLLGSNWKFYNNTAYTSNGSGGSAFIEVTDRYGTANGTETYTYKNNVLYNANNTWTAYYNGLSGAASTAWAAATTTNSVIYNFTSAPSGSGVVTTNPLWVSSIVDTADSNLSKVYIQSGSPAKGSAATGLTFWNTSTDYNAFAQTSPPSMGALQYGSTAGTVCTTNGSFCSLNSDCCSTYCVSNACSVTPACINNGNACSGDSDCCSGNCSNSFCAVAGVASSNTGIKTGTTGSISSFGKISIF